MADRILRRIRTAHCKRGPDRCEACRAAARGRICLLELSPPGQGLAQRRLISVSRGGEQVWREYDVLRVFADEEEALCYARAQHLDDVEL